MLARLDFPRFLVPGCYSGHLSGNKSEEKASVPKSKIMPNKFVMFFGRNNEMGG